jgi:hypothetical protein
VVWKAGTRARRWLDVVAARLASPERSNPEVATPRHEQRARRRPSAFAAGSAKNDDADARERMTFEMRGGCRAYRRSRDRRARVHACAPFP